MPEGISQPSPQGSPGHKDLRGLQSTYRPVPGQSQLGRAGPGVRAAALPLAFSEAGRGLKHGWILHPEVGSSAAQLLGPKAGAVL